MRSQLILLAGVLTNGCGPVKASGANAKGQQMICLDDRMADRLGAMRQPVERWGEVIRLVWSG